MADPDSIAPAATPDIAPIKTQKPPSRPFLVIDRDEAVAEWVGARCANIHRSFAGPFRAIGVGLGGELVAGFVYSNYQPEFGTIEMSLAAATPRWAARRIISVLLRYPFEALDCQRISVICDATNHKAIRLAEGVGFEREADLCRYYGPERDAVLLRLFREDWRGGKYGPPETGQTQADQTQAGQTQAGHTPAITTETITSKEAE